MYATGHNGSSPRFGRVVLVASLGGMEAFTTVLSGLPATFAVPVAVVQHRPRTGDGRDALAAVLARRTDLPVRVAELGAPAHEPGVTVVPGATAATIDPMGRWRLAPATAYVGDALLTSCAEFDPTIAVIMTGRLADGSQGCRAVKRHGGRVLVQDPASARASSMPLNGIATGCIDFVLPPDRLSTALLALTTAPGAADLLTVPLPPWARLYTADEDSGWAVDSMDASPAALKRAARFIDENAHRDIGLTDIADSAHVTPRTVQYLFRGHHGMSPMQYLRRVRLDRAHRELLEGNPMSTTVAQIAARWGFTHIGRFAIYYRQTYGRTPHATLRA